MVSGIIGLLRGQLVPGELLGELRAIQEGRLMPSTDLLGRLEARLSFLESENRSLRAQVQFAQPKKRRSPGEWTFRVLGWEWREVQMFPHTAPEGKMIRCLRIFVPPEDMPGRAAFWDIVRQREIAVLEPMLPHLKGTDTRVHIIQEGDGPRSMYQISFHPPAS